MDEHSELRRVQQKGEARQVRLPDLPPPRFTWPSSRPGPLATPPPPGQKPMPLRTDQMVEIDYNQEKGIPATAAPGRWLPDEARGGATGFDQLETAQEASRKRRRRR
jgi:hypothetical protein